MNLENNQLEELNIKLDYDTSKISWLKSGGKSKYFCNIKSLNHLTDLFKVINDHKIPYLVVGNFSNILIQSSGFNGLILKLSGEFSNIDVSNNIITAGSSVLDSKFSMFCYQNSFTGYEYLFTIPGTIGGNIFMNAGCYGFEISKHIKKIKIFDILTLKTSHVFPSEINFKYRKGYQEKNKLILSADFYTELGDPIIIKSKMNDFDNKRKKSQPQKVNCCGSIFKNPSSSSAWQLIKSSVDDSFYMGEIRLSKKHSNFFENDPYVDADKLINFLKKVEDSVLKKHSIKLEKELRIIGD